MWFKRWAAGYAVANPPYENIAAYCIEDSSLKFLTIVRYVNDTKKTDKPDKLDT